jgi:hypothetical protein
MSFITVVCLLCIQATTAFSLVQASTCSNKETRKAVVNEALIHIGCEDYNCGKVIISTSYTNINNNIG